MLFVFSKAQRLLASLWILPKIFLYKEDFHKFLEALNETVNHVKSELLPDVDFTQFENEESDAEEMNIADEDSDLKWD